MVRKWLALLALSPTFVGCSFFNQPTCQQEPSKCPAPPAAAPRCNGQAATSMTKVFNVGGVDKVFKCLDLEDQVRADFGLGGGSLLPDGAQPIRFKPPHRNGGWYARNGQFCVLSAGSCLF